MSLSFLIPLQIDSIDRLINLKISTNYIKHHYPDSEIIISELDTESKIGSTFINCTHIFSKTNDFFNKQKAFNIAAKNSTKDIIALYDADVIADINAINKSIDMLNSDTVDIVWPYNGKFYDVPKQLHSVIEKDKSIKNIQLNFCTLFSAQSVGGAVFLKKHVFFEGGGGNENFKGAGWEDNEIYDRFTRLGYRRAKLDTYLLHLNHERKDTSYNYNPYGKENQNEYVRIRDMNKEELLKEISTWHWCK